MEGSWPVWVKGLAGSWPVLCRFHTPTGQTIHPPISDRGCWPVVGGINYVLAC